MISKGWVSKGLWEQGYVSNQICLGESGRTWRCYFSQVFPTPPNIPPKRGSCLSCYSCPGFNFNNTELSHTLLTSVSISLPGTFFCFSSSDLLPRAPFSCHFHKDILPDLLDNGKCLRYSCTSLYCCVYSFCLLSWISVTLQTWNCCGSKSNGLSPMPGSTGSMNELHSRNSRSCVQSHTDTVLSVFCGRF